MADVQELPAATEPTDAELMHMLGRGDLQALGVLVDRYQKPVRVVAYRLLGRWDEADDVAQDAFLRLMRGADRYQPETALMALLRRVVVNLCLDRRKRRRAGPWPEAEPPARTPAGSPLESDERKAAIWAEIERLPERQRVALVLHRFEGLGHDQIAELTGWSTPAVESLLVRAYGTLRERLRRWV